MIIVIALLPTNKIYNENSTFNVTQAYCSQLKKKFTDIKVCWR